MLMLSLYAGAQTNIFPSTGRAGINTLSPQASFQVQGGVRVGSLTNYLNIDSATGSLSFVGTAGYQVANNQFAFSAAKSPSAGFSLMPKTCVTSSGVPQGFQILILALMPTEGLALALPAQPLNWISWVILKLQMVHRVWEKYLHPMGSGLQAGKYRLLLAGL